jgi:hypothetical protein
LEANSSSAGTSRGSASTIVTREPKLANRWQELDADHPAAEHDDPLGDLVEPGWPRCW